MSLEDAEELDRGLARASREYNQVLNRDNSWRKGPFLVSANVSELAFEQWVGQLESHWRLSWEPSSLEDDAVGSGFCWMYGDPDPVHDLVSGYFTIKMGSLLVQMGAIDHVRCCHTATQKLVHRRKEPDWCLQLDTDSLETPPSLVVEVAHTNESFAELQREIKEWVQGNALARIAIGFDVKRKLGTSGSPGSLKLRTFMMRRGDQDISDVLDFSNVEAVGEAVVSITAHDIFGDQVPAGVNEDAELKLDLFPLKCQLKRLLTI